jgi:hypothetical protein
MPDFRVGATSARTPHRMDTFCYGTCADG